MIFVSLIFGMIHYFKNRVKGHDNILKIIVTYISENLFLTKTIIIILIQNVHICDENWHGYDIFLPKRWYFTLKMSDFSGFCPDHMVSLIGLKIAVHSLLIRTYKHSNFYQNRKTWGKKVHWFDMEWPFFAFDMHCMALHLTAQPHSMLVPFITDSPVPPRRKDTLAASKTSGFTSLINHTETLHTGSLYHWFPLHWFLSSQFSSTVPPLWEHSSSK